MKTSTIFLLLYCLLNVKCNSQNNSSGLTGQIKSHKNKSGIQKIELTERTRGTNRIFTFEPASLNISLNGTATQRALSPADWENVTKQAALINVSKISTYTAPTTGRYSDSALASTIIITAAGKTYESSSFDAEIPPKELEGLYQLLKGKSQILIK